MRIYYTFVASTNFINEMTVSSFQMYLKEDFKGKDWGKFKYLDHWNNLNRLSLTHVYNKDLYPIWLIIFFINLQAFRNYYGISTVFVTREIVSCVAAIGL